MTTGADCEDANKKLKEINDKVDKTIDFFSDWDNLVMVYDAITMQFFKYLDEVSDCSTLKNCNNAKYEQAKLLFNFASLFYGGGELKAFNTFASNFWIRIMNKLPDVQAKVLANLLKDKNFTDRVKKINEDPNKKELLEGVIDDLPPSTWRKIVEDPELLEVWNRIKNKVCPFLARSQLGKCDDLRQKVFQDLDAKQIKKWDIDAENKEFFDNLVADKDLLDGWKVFSDLPDSKAWVRIQIPILEKMKGLDATKQKSLRDIYAKIKIARPRTGTLPKVTVKKTIPGFGDITIKYDKYGFPKFEDWVPLPKNDYKFDLPNNPRPSNDFKAANEALEAKFGSRDSDKFKWDGSKPYFEVKQPDGTWVQYTWHHHQDGKTLIPVPSNVHHAQPGIPSTGFSHTGGDKLLSVGLEGIFEGPNLGN